MSETDPPENLLAQMSAVGPYADLEYRISTAFEDTIDTFTERETPDLRIAAYVVALDRVGDTHEARELFH